MDLVSYVNLKKIEKIVDGEKITVQQGQSIYSSQLYGTFFSVFGIFDASYDEKTNHYKINSIKLKIVNYKGELDIAIINATLKTKSFEGKNRYYIDITVQAAVNTTNNEDLVVVKNCSGIEISPNTEESSILVRRFLKPIHQKESENNYPALNDGIFDSEFFFRQGYFERNTAEMTGNHVPAQPSSEYTSAQAAGGRLCPFSRVWFV